MLRELGSVNVVIGRLSLVMSSNVSPRLRQALSVNGRARILNYSWAEVKMLTIRSILIGWALYR